MATEAKERGNELYKAGSYDAAIEAYNEAICKRAFKRRAAVSVCHVTDTRPQLPQKAPLLPSCTATELLHTWPSSSHKRHSMTVPLP